MALSLASVLRMRWAWSQGKDNVVLVAKAFLAASKALWHAGVHRKVRGRPLRAS